MNTNILLTSEIAVSSVTSGTIAYAVDASPLLTALITFGVSIVTLVGGEIVKYLVAYFKKKTKELNGDEEAEKQDVKDK